jgi:hypothetical protein
MDERTHQPGGVVNMTGPPAVLRKGKLRQDEASAYLEQKHGVTVAPSTLAKLRSVGGGPSFHKFGRSVLYPRDSLDDWALGKLGRLLRNTSKVAEREAAERSKLELKLAAEAAERRALETEQRLKREAE